MSDARKRIYLFFTVFRACSTPFKECRVGFYIKIGIEKNIFRYYLSHLFRLRKCNYSLWVVLSSLKNGQI